jgi:predicted dehydrogenase
MEKLIRRDFVKGAAISALSYSRVLGANDRVGLALIGVGNRGSQVQDAFQVHRDCQTVAVCDLNEDYMDLAVRKSETQPARYKDYRKAIENREVDAVMIATPDHWHALMTVDACRAGKDVYVEKPLSLTVKEGRKMVETAEGTRRVVQVGIQRRSSRGLQEAAEFVRSGGIGRVTVARSFHVQNEWPLGIGAAEDGRPPDEDKW